jgi:hypothetical protein
MVPLSEERCPKCNDFMTQPIMCQGAFNEENYERWYQKVRLPRSLCLLADQATALRFIGRDAYRDDGNGVVYEMVRVAPARLRAFRALV